MVRRLAALLLGAITIGVTPSLAQIQVTVQGDQGPWNQSLNPNFSYGVNDNANPTVISASDGIPFVTGGTITVAYVSGTVSVCPGPPNNCPYTDANGWYGFPTDNIVGPACGKDPSFYMSPYPIYASELVGTFASNGVIVGKPFAIGDGPTTLTIPSGANQLLLGVDDNCYNDNGGSWTLSISSQGKVPVAASAPSKVVAVTGSTSFDLTLEWKIPYSGNSNGFVGDLSVTAPCPAGFDVSFSGPAATGTFTESCPQSPVAQIILAQPSPSGGIQVVRLTVTAELNAPINQLINMSICGLPMNGSTSFCISPQIQVQNVTGLSNLIELTGLSATQFPPSGVCEFLSLTSACFTIQQNFFVYQPTDPNGPFPSYWVQNILAVVNNATHGWMVTPLYEFWNTTSDGATGCIIDTNFTPYTGQCQVELLTVIPAQNAYLEHATWTPISSDGGFASLGLESTISLNGSGADVIGMTTFLSGSTLISFGSNVVLPTGSFISAGQGISLTPQFFDPQLALVSLPGPVGANFGIQTAGTISSQVQLGQSWISTLQAPFVSKTATNACSSTLETSRGLNWSKDGSTFNSSEHQPGEGISFVPGTGTTCP